MNKYEHSVCLDPQKCTGCTTCLKHCPTEAIRIKNNRAEINQERCIDCGECIRVCPQKAKKAVCSKLDAMDKFKWKIALPAPTLYGQFDNLDDVDCVLDGLLKIGFDDVFEVSAAAELVSAYTRRYLKTQGVKKLGMPCNTQAYRPQVPLFERQHFAHSSPDGDSGKACKGACKEKSSRA